MRLPAPALSTASRCAVTMLFGLGAQQKPELGAPLLGDSAPAWSDLQAKVHATATGTRMLEDEAAWSRGAGPTHTDAKLRLFGQKEEDVRVVFYRDTAAWCPYCQKVWLLLEEKQIPYRVSSP
jgi:glutathione S-transferase